MSNPTNRVGIDFTVALERNASGEYRSLVLESPVGSRSEALFEPPFDKGETEAILRSLGARARLGDSSGGFSSFREVRRTDTGPRIEPRQIGTALYEALFRGAVRDAFLRSLERAHAPEATRLRLRLVFGTGPEFPDYLAALPWELLCPPGSFNFLTLGEQVSVVRELAVPQQRRSLPGTGPVRVLVAMAQPAGSDPLKLRREWATIQKDAAPGNSVTFVPFDGASIQQLRKHLRDGQFQGLHFMGHGLFNRDKGIGQLFFEGPGGAAAPVSGSLLATNLRDLPDLRFTVLNACHTGSLAGTADIDPFLGVASALLLSGQSAVIAMQAAIPDSDAIAFSQGFYGALARGRALESAVFEGRLSILNARSDSSAAWAIPVLFMTPGAESRPSASQQPHVSDEIRHHLSIGTEPSSSPTLLDSFHDHPAPQPIRRPREQQALAPETETRESGQGSSSTRKVVRIWLFSTLILLMTLLFTGLKVSTGGSSPDTGNLTKRHSEPQGPEVDPESVQAEPSPSFEKKTREPLVANGSRDIRLSDGSPLYISADHEIPRVFLDALRALTLPYHQDSSKVTIYFEPTRTSETEKAGLPWKVCRAAATPEVASSTGGGYLGRIEIARSHSDELTACNTALQSLAESLINNISTHIKKGS